MAEINAVESWKKNVSVDSAEVETAEQNNSSEEKTTEQKPETTNVFAAAGEAKTTTSPIQKDSKTTSENQSQKAAPIEMAKVDTEDVGFDTFVSKKPQAATQETEKKTETQKKEKYAWVKNLFEERLEKKCLDACSVKSEQEKDELRKKIKTLMSDLKKLDNAEDKEELVAAFLCDNRINISEDTLKDLVNSYIRLNGVSDKTRETILNASSQDNTINSGFFRKYRHNSNKLNYSQRKAVEEEVGARIQKNQISIEASEIYSAISANATKFIIPMQSIDEAKIKADIAEFVEVARNAETEEELYAIVDDAYRYLDENMDKKALEAFIQKLCEEKGRDINNIRKAGSEYNNQRTLSRVMLLNLFKETDEKSQRVRNAIIARAGKDIKESHKTLNKVVFKYHTPKSVDEARKMAEATEEFIHLQAADLKEIVKAGGFDEEVVEQVAEMSEKLIKNARKYTEEFLEVFFETEVGQQIKKQTQYAVQEVKEAKVEFEECKENTTQATEEAQEAKKQSEKAKQEAMEEQKKAESIAANLGLKDLDFKSLYKVVKQESPRQANNLLYAKAKQKQAYWAEYDANVAQHHAEFLEGLAKQHFEFAQMKVAAAFAKMQAMMSVIH